MLTIGLEPIYVQALLEWNWATLWPRLSCPRSTRLNSPKMPFMAGSGQIAGYGGPALRTACGL